jgi:hypothetical protein
MQFCQLPVLMKPSVAFMASSTGRIVRIVTGIALITFGLVGLQGASGILAAVIGAVLLLAGLFDFCVFAPLLGCPLSGPKMRAGKKLRWSRGRDPISGAT